MLNWFKNHNPIENQCFEKEENRAAMATVVTVQYTEFKIHSHLALLALF